MDNFKRELDAMGLPSLTVTLEREIYEALMDKVRTAQDLRLILRAFVAVYDMDYWQPHLDSESLPYGYECILCEAHTFSHGDYKHKDTCPLVLARKILEDV